METASGSVHELLVNRSSIAVSELREATVSSLGPGQIRLLVEKFALTANNVTYAQFGDMLDYWNFFPVDSEWGKVPAMGWARVTESNVDGIAPADRFYGWFPMATSVDVTATPTSTGFRDDGPHRSKQAAAYRNFTRSDLDGLYTTPEDEDRHALLRGLYVTGFLIEAFLSAQHYLGAEQSLVLSASSKTALSYAHCARSSGGMRLVGLTSVSNRDFVAALGAYDEVLTYDQLDQVAMVPSVLIDMSGAGAVVAALHSRLGDQIAHSMVVGKSHHDAPARPVPAGPQPEMFFAPTAMGDRLLEWGPGEYQQRIVRGLTSFLHDSREWLKVEHSRGPAAVQEAWKSLVGGVVAPSSGIIATMHSS